MTRSVLEELPEAPLARWASVFLSLSVLSILISLAASQIFFSAAGVAYLLHVARLGRNGKTENEIRFPPVKLPLAFFCLLTLLSVFWAANSTVGWLAVRKLVLFLIWLLGASLVVSGKHREWLFRALFLESAVAGLVAGGQFAAHYRAVRELHPDRIYAYMTSNRASGFMGHWMNFGGQQMLVFAALLAFLLAGLLFARKSSTSTGQSNFGQDGKTAGPERRVPAGSRNALWWIVLVVIAASIILNFSRGVWLGSLAAAVYLISRWRARWLWALPALLLIGYLAAPSLVRKRIESLRHPAQDPSLAIRFEMWQVAGRMIERHPLVGVGPNNVQQVYVLYLPPGKSPEAGYHEHFHNNLIQFAAERGLPCMLAWVWLMAALVWHLVKVRRQLRQAGREAWVADAAIAGWLAFIVEGCFEFNFGTSPVLMLFLFVTAVPFAGQGKVNGEK